MTTYSRIWPFRLFFIGVFVLSLLAVDRTSVADDSPRDRRHRALLEKRQEILESLHRDLNSIANKTAQPLITGSMVTELRGPHPPLDEQRAVVGAAQLARQALRGDGIELGAQVIKQGHRSASPSRPGPNSPIPAVGSAPAC